MRTRFVPKPPDPGQGVVLFGTRCLPALLDPNGYVRLRWQHALVLVVLRDHCGTAAGRVPPIEHMYSRGCSRATGVGGSVQEVRDVHARTQEGRK
ncbi:Uncharacterised protein [Mycobacteroides abscessus subsp. abscessus]|nr:Uncharacterised protein [Mycobacteroides abscessus subsp. abscessus]